MDNTIYIDVVVTWLGAIGCALYCRFLLRQEDESIPRVTLFLFGLLAYLLAVRGFYWLHETWWLGRLVFAGATLLPLAIVLYVERLLRRHAPFTLKVVTLAVTIFFFLANFFHGVGDNPTFLVAFLVSFVITVGWAGALLLRVSSEQLTLNETRRVYVMIVVALLALPLVVTDFRTQLPQIPVRLGAIGALICIYVLLRVEHGRAVMARSFFRLGVMALTALLLAAVIGATLAGFTRNAVTIATNSFAPALGWMLLTGIWVRIDALAAETRSQSFARWLLRSRLDSVDGFVSSLKFFPLLQQHIVMVEGDLKDYDLTSLQALAQSSHEPFSVADARRFAKAEGSSEQGVGEQLLDLFERYHMTHALFISNQPTLLLLVNLPEGAEAAVGRLHAGVIQKIARRLSGPT